MSMKLYTFAFDEIFKPILFQLLNPWNLAFQSPLPIELAFALRHPYNSQIYMYIVYERNTKVLFL